MKIRFSILLILLFLRVLVMPAWCSVNASSLKVNGHGHAQVKLHKRRSSFLEDGIISHEISILSDTGTFITRNLFKVPVNFLRFGYFRPFLFLLTFSQRFIPSSQYLFLTNRMLRL